MIVMPCLSLDTSFVSIHLHNIQYNKYDFDALIINLGTPNSGFRCCVCFTYSRLFILDVGEQLPRCAGEPPSSERWESRSGLPRRVKTRFFRLFHCVDMTHNINQVPT